jgi:hypothetical protein
MAGIYLFLSAGFAAAAALVCFAGCAFLLASPQYRSVQSTVAPVWRQLGGVAAAALLVVLAYSTFAGDFVRASFYGGWLGSAVVGRLLFAHDAMATEAVAALAVIGIVGATAAWRMRERGR